MVSSRGSGQEGRLPSLSPLTCPCLSSPQETGPGEQRRPFRFGRRPSVEGRPRNHGPQVPDPPAPQAPDEESKDRGCCPMPLPPLFPTGSRAPGAVVSDVSRSADLPTGHGAGPHPAAPSRTVAAGRSPWPASPAFILQAPPWERSRRRSTLPEALRGMAATNSTRRGSLNEARMGFRWAITSSADQAKPGLSTM